MEFPYGQPIPLADIPSLEPGVFVQAVAGQLDTGGRLAALFGAPRCEGGVQLLAVVALDDRRSLWIVSPPDPARPTHP